MVEIRNNCGGDGSQKSGRNGIKGTAGGSRRMLTSISGTGRKEGWRVVKVAGWEDKEGQWQQVQNGPRCLHG